VFIAGFRPEHVFLAWFASFVALFVRGRIHKLARERKQAAGLLTPEQREKKGVGETVVVRGKTFTTVADDGAGVDLGWLGTLPYWIPVAVFGIESAQLSIFGERAFKLRGYTPAQRGFVQLVLFFGVLPVLDLAMGDDWANPTKAQIKERKLAKRFRLPLYAWCAVEALATWTTYRLCFAQHSAMTRGNRVALMATLLLFNGVFGITISHELIHKQSALEQWLGYLLLVNVNYCHWGEEHLSGHHETVATPLDPATARRGETLFAFLPRTYVGGFLSSCALEEKRLRLAQGLSEGAAVRWWTADNRIVRGVAASAALSVVLARYAARDWRAVPAFYACAVGSSLLLEVVNYMEHFGLERKLLASGEYEPVNPTHSWNAPNRLSNAVLYKLQRHSDHHTFASRPYEILRNFAESPQLPTGYPGCFVMCFVPPVWFNIMDDLLDAHKLEYNPEREPTAEECARADALKHRAKAKTWLFSIAGMGLVGATVKRVMAAA